MLTPVVSSYYSLYFYKSYHGIIYVWDRTISLWADVDKWIYRKCFFKLYLDDEMRLKLWSCLQLFMFHWTVVQILYYTVDSYHSTRQWEKFVYPSIFPFCFSPSCTFFLTWIEGLRKEGHMLFKLQSPLRQIGYLHWFININGCVIAAKLMLTSPPSCKACTVNQQKCSPVMWVRNRFNWKFPGAIFWCWPFTHCTVWYSEWMNNSGPNAGGNSLLAAPRGHLPYTLHEQRV